MISYMARYLFILIFYCGFGELTRAQYKQTFEAENATLLGNAEIVTSCGNASNGQMVKGLGGGSANAIHFENISVEEAGEYYITVSYYSVSNREFSYQINEGTEQSESVNASGDWCYLGGVPGDHIFKGTLIAGTNKILLYDAPIIDRIIVSSDTASRQASTIYFSSSEGNDESDGLTPQTAFQTIAKANSLKLLPGDSLLFKSDDTFLGQFMINSESGLPDTPIVISSYGQGKLPVFDGNGFLSTIHVINSSYLHFSNIEIKNDGGPSQPGTSEDLRYGMYIQNSFSDGTIFKHYRLNNLTFKNIYPTTQISDNDQTGINAHAIITSGSWGDTIHKTRFSDMRIENCFFTRTGRHAAVFKAVNQLNIKNNLFEHVGGAGMVIGGGCTNILVENNVTNYTGSSIDSRMAGRGSGLWCFQSTNLTVQYNKFMHAKGIKDSYGMHIDIGNRNVVYQYNYSEDNEGGFVEILGKNRNVGYRYNLSVGDGWRTRGNQKGSIFWFAGWSGDPQNPIGSDSIFVYNNSVYVRDSITPGILIEGVSRNARVYNNIINVANEFGRIQIKNQSIFNDFDYNIWYGNISDVDEDGQTYRGPNSMTSNPLYKDEVVVDSSGFILQSGSPALGNGKLIYDSEISYPYDFFHNNGSTDFYGNLVSNTSSPNIGAYNGEGGGVSAFRGFEIEQSFHLYPNPVDNNQSLIIEIPSSVNTQNLTIQIVDVMGRMRFEKSFQQQNKLNLKLSKLSRGSYFVKVKTDDFQGMKQLLIF